MQSNAILKHPHFVNRVRCKALDLTSLFEYHRLITSFLLTSRALNIDVTSCTVSLCVAIAMSFQYLHSQFQVANDADE